MVSVVIPSPDDDGTAAEHMQPWEISRGELSAYLIFFENVGYFSGFRPQSVMIRIGEPFLLKLPSDAALEKTALVSGFFTTNPRETISEAMVVQAAQEFSSVPGEIWAYHPKYFQTTTALKSGKAAVPAVGMSFLDGLWCPRDDVPIDEVLLFKEERAPEREAFLAALMEASENVEIESHGLVLGVPIEKLEKALSELNRSAIERWARGVKRSFRWGIRPNEKTLLSLAAAAGSYDFLGNSSVSVLLALWGAVEFSVDLTPRLEPVSDATKAISYMMDVRRTYDNPELYTRYRLKSVGGRKSSD